MANANDLRKGMCIRYNSNPAIVLEVQHRTPGNLRAFVQVIIRYIEGKAANVELPSTVILTVTESPEGVRGDSANNVQKMAVLETGRAIQVPLFIKEGEKIKVSTADGSYLGRA